MTKWKTSWRLARSLPFPLAVLISGCDRPRAERILPPPSLVPLEVLSTIRGDSLVFSGIAPVDHCRVWAVGGAWGLVVEIDLLSGKSSRIGQFPGWKRQVQLGPGKDGQLLAWAQVDPMLGWVDTRTATFRPLGPPNHPWVGPAVGPSVALRGGEIGVAPIGGRPLVRSPRPWLDDPPASGPKQDDELIPDLGGHNLSAALSKAWIDAPLISILDQSGKVIQNLGMIQDRGGYYLSAALAQVRLGRVGDSLLAFYLSDATLDVYPPLGVAGRGVSPIRRRPHHYFRAPEPSEEVWEANWLINGQHPLVQHLPQVAEATFSPDGRLFLIRIGSARWKASDNPLARTVFRRPGRWVTTSQWLEVHSPSGELLGAYSLPGSGATDLVADGAGQLYLWGDGGVVSVVRDPMGPEACRIQSPLIEVPFNDSPHGHPLIPLTPNFAREEVGQHSPG